MIALRNISWSGTAEKINPGVRPYRTLEQATQALFAYIPVRPTSTSVRYTLDRMRAMLDMLHSPQETFKSVHIAGTSGKTSTAYFVTALLQAAGARTGTTVSPHIDALSDRLQFDGAPSTPKDFAATVSAFLPIIEASNIGPSYFELLIAMFYWEAARRKVDYAVVETGVGGLVDGTNVITRADKVCVITDIGLDHTELLGDTIIKIAHQKAGIIQPGNHVIVKYQDQAILDVFIQTAKRQGASLQVVKVRNDVPAFLPVFQAGNWSLARAVYEYVAQRDGLPQLTAKQIEAAAHHEPPARMETFKVKGKTVIVDGAHNPQKMAALRQSLQARGYNKLAVLANFMNSPGKVDPTLAELQLIAAHLIVPAYVVHQDMGRIPFGNSEFEARAHNAGITSIEIKPDVQSAVDALLARPEKVVLVTGSLYLASQIRPLLTKAR